MPLLIKNGTLIDGTGTAPFHASIAIDRSIVALGLEADQWASQHTDLVTIDASGCTVMPGLIDAHCHISFDEPFSTTELFYHRREGLSALVAAYNLQRVLRAGVTGIFDADCIFDTSLDVRDAAEANIITGPRMTCGGNALFTSVGGTAGRLIPDHGNRGYSHITRTPDEIVAEIRRQAKNGVDWIKVHTTGLLPRRKEAGEIQVWTAAELQLAANAAHDLGIPIVAHCRNASSTRDAARAGFDMILHATHMDEEALDAVVKAKVPIVPTLTFQWLLAHHGEKVGASLHLRDIFAREINDSSIMLRRAWQAGVPMLTGSESGFSVTPYGEWHWLELQIFIDHLGMSPLEAISCATKESARALLRHGQTGILKVGADADVIVVAGNVASDIRLLGEQNHMRHVISQGRMIDLCPPPLPRGHLSGWQVDQYTSIPLTRAKIL